MVAEIARRISSDYQGCEPVLVGVLKGAFHFLSDLARQLTIPVQIDFVSVASYGDGTSSSGRIRLVKDIEIDVRDRHILIVEDIVDTGLTLKYLIDHLQSFGPRSVRVCTLLDKHERRQTQVGVEYSGHTLDRGFLVGYGLDYAENYRELRDIYHLKL